MLAPLAGCLRVQDFRQGSKSQNGTVVEACATVTADWRHVWAPGPVRHECEPLAASRRACVHCAPRMARSSTYSIVACDLERREWGVAVQSRFLAIGALASWAEAEVGAVATQSFMNTDYGRTGLRLIAEGLSAYDALARVVASDPEPEKRQVGVVDRDGAAVSHTGEACMPWAGHRIGPGFAAQGNMLVSATTIDALADTFTASDGPLARRLL